MRKHIALLLLFAIGLAWTACAGAPAGTSEEMPKAAAAPTDTPANTTKPVPEEKENEQERTSEVLVVYFSATGTTRALAERIAAICGAELAEIVPAQPYTAEDLNYNDRSSRSTAEQNDPDARPEIAGDISLDGYDAVYLGYPIWWGEAPRIMASFVESHDFSGITVIPFCTSGSTDIGQSDDALAALAGSGSWLQGRRFPGGISDEGLRAWIRETGGMEMTMEKNLRLYIGDTALTVDWEENEAVNALRELACAEPLTVQMSMYGDFEQVGALGTSLPDSDARMTTHPGDIVLYGGDRIVVFYGSNSWAYTRLGTITDKSEAELTELLGSGDVQITLTGE